MLLWRVNICYYIYREVWVRIQSAGSLLNLTNKKTYGIHNFTRQKFKKSKYSYNFIIISHIHATIVIKAPHDTWKAVAHYAAIHIHFWRRFPLSFRFSPGQTILFSSLRGGNIFSDSRGLFMLNPITIKTKNSGVARGREPPDKGSRHTEKDLMKERGCVIMFKKLDREYCHGEWIISK